MKSKIPKIRKYKSGRFYIKFRIHKPLQIYFNREFITKSLISNTISKANNECSIIYEHYQNILNIYQGRLLDDNQIKSLINKFVIEVLKQNSLEIPNKEIVTYKIAYEKFKVYYENENLGKSTKNQTYKALELFLILIGSNKEISKTQPLDLIDIKTKISKLGNRNYKEYKILSLNEYIKITNVPEEKRINDGSIKTYIKHIKKFFTFCLKNKIIKYNPSDILHVKVDLDKKDPFNDYEISLLTKHLVEMNSKIKWLYLSIIYSGMRRSEIYNCTIEIENGIKYFNIYSSKTRSGIRKIPLHNHLKNLTNDDLEEAKRIAVNSVNAGAIFAKKIKPIVTTDKRKSLHTIRHWVATKLKRKGVHDSMIKQILGHSPSDTLNSVYAREAYTLKQLLEIINKL